VPFAVFLIAYFSFVNLTGMYVSYKLATIRLKIHRFNTYVGANINSSGMWNQSDANVLMDFMKQEPFDAQKIHEQLLNLAIQRVKSQGTGNLKLVIKRI